MPIKAHKWTDHTVELEVGEFVKSVSEKELPDDSGPPGDGLPRDEADDENIGQGACADDRTGLPRAA